MKSESCCPSCADEPPAAAKFSPKFVIAALLVTLTLGAGSGMFYLWRIGVGADVPVSHRQLHAYSQILGFGALFVMGVAFHALPRMIGAPFPSRAITTGAFWLTLSGVVLRNLAQPFVFFGFGRGFALLSGLLSASGGALFAAYVLPAVAAAPREPDGRRDPLPLFVGLGTVAFLAALGVNVLQGAWLAANGDASLPASLNEPFYVLSLFGFLLGFIFGFASRMVPVFLATGPLARRSIPVVLAAQVLGVTLHPVSYLPGVPDETALLLRDAGTALVAVAAAAFVAGLGVLWRRARTTPMKVKGSPEVALRGAFGFLALFSILSLGGVVVARSGLFPAQNPWWLDAARHVFTIGFLTLLVLGMSVRVLPVFAGKILWSGRMAQATFGLVALGVALRLLQYPAAWKPALYVVGSYMGVPVVLGLVLFAINLRMTMRPRREKERPGPSRTALLPAYGAPPRPAG